MASGKSQQDQGLANTPSMPPVPEFRKLAIEGSLTSAFQMTVDGVAYEDSEDFYSTEVLRLPDKAAAAGFAGWQARFEAVLGFSDLARGMTVYVAPIGKTGYSGSASVSMDGKFRVEIPFDGKDSNYNVRAVKRVNIVLSKDKEVRRFCYNFSANLKEISLQEGTLPFILDEFQTRWTLYSCEPGTTTASTGGLQLPVGVTPMPDLQNSPSTTQQQPLPVPQATISSTSSAASLGIAMVGDSEKRIIDLLGEPNRRDAEIGWTLGVNPVVRSIWRFDSLGNPEAAKPCLLYFEKGLLCAADGCVANLLANHSPHATCTVVRFP
jgi:hypothetical protein